VGGNRLGNKTKGWLRSLEKAGSRKETPAKCHPGAASGAACS